MADADCFWSYPLGKRRRNRRAKCQELPAEYNITDNDQLVFDTTADGLSKNHSKGLCLRDCPIATADKECRMSYVKDDEGEFESARAMYRCMDVEPALDYVDVIA